MDGILNLAKPAGPTSHDMVALVRRLAATRRVGHGGTLDPFARGVLPLFLGRATRLVEYHLGDAKEYRATVCFGASSTTDDLEGELTPTERVPDRAAVEAGLEQFRGPIVQTPPAYSAIRVAGRRAYALARAGLKSELTPRSVTITRLELVEWDETDPARPIAIVDVSCSAGTYIRALARDLGASLSSAAYLGALVRTASGPFRLEDARMLDEVRAAAGTERLDALLLPVDTGLEAMPAIRLEPDELAAVTRGQFVRPRATELHEGADPHRRQETRVRLLDGAGHLVAIAEWRGERLAPEKVLIDVVPAHDVEVRREEAAGRAAVNASAAADRDPSPDADPDPASFDDA